MNWVEQIVARCTANVLRHRLIPALVGILWAVHPALVIAEEKKCECTFGADSGYEAFGAKAACTAWLRSTPEKKSCKISFAGLDADASAVSNILNRDASNYRSEAFNLLHDYFYKLEKNDTVGLTEPDFLQTALPIFLRGAYLSASASEAIDQAKLDAVVTDFFTKNSKDVSEVFRGERQPFSTEFGEAKFFVGDGIIIVDYMDSKFVTTYLPKE